MLQSFGPPDLGLGVGFKPEHFDAIEATHPDLQFFEVHAENYMGAGGMPHAMLRRLRDSYALSIHGVGLNIGSQGALDLAHLQRLKRLVQIYEPALVSEHLAWSSHDEAKNRAYLNDLLPVPYTRAVLNTVVDHIDQVQETLGRRVLIENPSTYLSFVQAEMGEVEFIAEMQYRTGCALILDLNNVHVSAVNQNSDAMTYLAQFPLHAVQEVHLAGHGEDADDLGDPILIDSHDRPVAPPVWALYEHLLHRLGPITTLIEWDNEVPTWDQLYGEAKAARAVQDAAVPATESKALA